ncbi:hypothetical protein [Microbacterium yannicii]|uniref:hypothetical protein n=1 Tax=Microbacterium yannicii TaxID=671622 RepID=UPI0002D7AEAB|nr:hypothetical protein [Microbacterium yannicii]
MSRHTSRRTARRERRRAALLPRLLLGALGTAAAIVLGVLTGGGTYAAWNVAATASAAATLQAGSAGLTASNLQLSAAGLYPGRTVYAASTVRNTGTTALALTIDPVKGPAAPTPFTQSLVISAGKAATAADCSAGRATAGATIGIGAATGSDLKLSLAPGASTLLCIGVGLPQNAPAAAAGAAASAVTITISGTQVRS